MCFCHQISIQDCYSAGIIQDVVGAKNMYFVIASKQGPLGALGPAAIRSKALCFHCIRRCVRTPMEAASQSVTAV